MQSNWKRCFELMLESEGGYVDHPADPGGRTNLGVTQATWENWVGRPSDEKEMRSLTPEKVEPLYKRKYWDACRCDELPIGVDYLVFDFAVNAGVGRSSKTLQSVVGSNPDGMIGIKTITATMTYGRTQLIDRFSDAKLAFYQGLPTFAVFGKGWTNRVNKTKQEALDMLKDKS